MATLNLSSNGPSINKAYQSIVNATTPTGPSASSPTYALWALFSVSTPLANAFAPASSQKESVLKLQSTGDGEVRDLIEDFSDGKIQFAFIKMKDPNTALQKSVLVAWCGEGVPERTKGYFTSHLAAVSKTLHGYHVQVTARSDRDLTPDSILQKISDASGSKYSSTPATFPAPTPSLSTKPVFTPTHGSTGGGGGFNPLASRSRFDDSKASNVDGDGWGADAPPVSRTSLEKVQSSYQPTKIDLRGPAAGGRGSEQDQSVTAGRVSSNADVVKGGYQPVGKVDISQIRAQSQHNSADDRSAPVKGAYEPVGKVDIAAIRARAQKSTTDHSTPSSEPASQSEIGGSVPHQSASLRGSERLTSLPKPKVANQFGTNVASFSGTKAPTPSGLGSDRKPTTTPVGVGRTFADQGGKTPAQIWAEKKTRERGLSATNDSLAGPSSSQKAQASVVESSGGTEWKSGYTGKSWASVQTTRTGQSSASTGEQHQEENQDVAEDTSPAESSGIEAIRSKFKDMPPIGAADAGESRARTLPPVLDMSNKPNAGQARPETSSPAQPAINEDLREQEDRMPAPPSRPPRSPTPPTPPAVTGSPIRVAMPVGRGSDGPKVTSAHDDLVSGSTMPTDSLSKALPREDDIPSDIGQTQDTARRAAEAVATETDQDTAPLSQEDGGLKALVQFDYEKAEDNEIELTEGEYVTNIEMVDDNWWMGQNARGESGLFPSNYVELTEEGKGNTQREDTTPAAEQPNGPTATALYDYEAAEENELSFPEGAVIRDIEFPDEDWWSGFYEQRAGLFPANYVKLDD